MPPELLRVAAARKFRVVRAIQDVVDVDPAAAVLAADLPFLLRNRHGEIGVHDRVDSRLIHYSRFYRKSAESARDFLRKFKVLARK